jgi:putative transposase
MRKHLTQADVEAVLACPKPAETSFEAKEWELVDRRIKALDAVLQGATISAAAIRHHIDRKTLARMIDNAIKRCEITGRLIGYQVCLPQKRFAERAPRSAVVPAKAHAFAFEQVLVALPDLSKLVLAFKGALPSRKRASPAFNRLYASIATHLRNNGHGNAYPLNTVDGGRRALQAFLRRMRDKLEAEEAAELPESPSTTRIEHLFALQPFDRVEMDEHRIDVDTWMALPLADGTYRLERVRQLWLLVIMDVATGAILAWLLVVGRKYHRLDVLSLFAKALRPWQPRELLLPDMRYSPRAWMPSCDLEDGLVARSLMAALDNDSSHLAKMSLGNLVDFHMGVLHYGRSGMGQGRPYIEALFKVIENELLRYVAGGFVPETPQGAKYATSTLQGDRYPLIVEFMEDLIDTYVSAHNVSSLSTRETRSPKELMQAYKASGGLLWRCPGTDEHARRLTVRRMEVTIRGSEANGVPPVVYQDYARYRSPQLTNQYRLIGRKFAATYENPDDIREMTLWDREGKRVMTLHAMAPYSAVPHSLAQRMRAAAWNRNPEARTEESALIQDNIVAYHAGVREAAAKMNSWASGLLLSGEVPKVTHPPLSRDTPAPLAGLRPPTGRFQLR